MYYPYLRSKQFEMLALRAMAESKNAYSHVTPIIEPIKDALAPILRAVDAMNASNISCAVVLNPRLRNIGNDLIGEEIINQLRGKNYIPALLCDTQMSNIIPLINKWELQDVMLVFKDGANSEDGEWDSILANNQVKYIVGDFGRSLKRKIQNAQKKVIYFDDDAFKSKNSNAQYDNPNDEKYTEEHAFYREDNYDGFADYCVLPKDMPDGGMVPTTLAIHLTYKKNSEQIWVKHFLSDSRLGRENIQKKFEEAAIHVREFYDKCPHTKAVDELLDYLQTEHYPGLGPLKKITIYNHLELVEQLLKELEDA